MTLVRVPEHIHSHSDRHRTAHQETERGSIRHLRTTYAAPQAACVAQEWRLGCVSTAHYLCVSLDTKRHTTWGVPGAQQSRFCSYQAAIIMSKSDAQWRESARSQRVLRFMRTHFGMSRPWASGTSSDTAVNHPYPKPYPNSSSAWYQPHIGRSPTFSGH